MHYYNSSLMDVTKLVTIMMYFVTKSPSQITSHDCLFNSVCGPTSQKIKVRIIGPLWGVFTDDRWIPRAKGQWRGKSFYVMASLGNCIGLTDLICSEFLFYNIQWNWYHVLVGVFHENTSSTSYELHTFEPIRGRPGTHVGGSHWATEKDRWVSSFSMPYKKHTSVMLLGNTHMFNTFNTLSTNGPF